MTRLCCIVPGCRRTRGDRKADPVLPGMEWICGAHWTAIPLMRRKVYALAKRLERAATGLKRGELALQRYDIWCALKSTAIERAAGL